MFFCFDVKKCIVFLSVKLCDTFEVSFMLLNKKFLSLSLSLINVSSLYFTFA